jgi:hypothetical protein
LAALPLALTLVAFGCDGEKSKMMTNPPGVDLAGLDLIGFDLTGFGQLPDGGGPTDGSGGADGPGCATGCSVGAKSCDGNSVRTCVAKGTCSEWSTGVPCAGGQVCSGGLCVANCANQCTAGASYCSQNGFRTCTMIGSCTDFSPTVTPCTNGAVCSGGACTDSCVDRCAAGATECLGFGVQTCERKSSGCLDWSDPRPCDSGQVCSGGLCVASCTNVCNAGDTRCVGTDSLQSCAKQASGCTDFSLPQLCASGGMCAAGACLACVAGTKRCGPTGNVEQCSNGLFAQVMSCAFGCASGACTSTVTCSPGAYQCNGNTVQICNSSGSAFLYSSTCSTTCTNGLCGGGCTAGATRCNAGNIEQCDPTGTMFAAMTMCPMGCDGASVTCIKAGTTFSGSSNNLDGVNVFAGPVVIDGTGVVTSATGDLTIRAPSITVNGSITIAATNSSAGSLGTDTDSVVSAGSAGTNGYTTTGYPCYGGSGGPGGKGGGVLRLIADTIVIAGQITAKGTDGTSGSCGGGGGGAGGGILIAADSLTVSSSANILASGGTGASGGSYNGSNGAMGRVKLLSGSVGSIAGTITPALGMGQTKGLLPPLTITSSTHPDSTLFYNDAFPAVGLSWNRPFTVQGYYYTISPNNEAVPMPAPTTTFTNKELVSIDPKLINTAGTYFFNIVPIDTMSNNGLVETSFKIQVNSTPPTVMSMTHTDSTTWFASQDVQYQWTFPHSDNNYQGAYYLIDHFGSTVPTSAATLLPVTQKKLLVTGLNTGTIWVFHIVTVDQQGYLTQNAGNYVARIGPDPGSGELKGKLTNMTNGSGISGATVQVNRGLFTTSTASDGSYDFTTGTVPAGSWEVSVQAAGFQAATKTGTVIANMPTVADFQLVPSP